jgi:hypothetical protein
MGHEGAVSLNPLVQRDKSIPVSIHREVGHDPHDETKEVDDRSDVIEDGPGALSAQVQNLHPDALGGPPCQLGIPERFRGLGAHHELRQLADRMGPDLLRQERASGTKDTGDLGPARLDWMSARNEVERRIGERERGASRVGDHHIDAEIPKTVGDDGSVRLPPFGRDREGSETRKTAQHLSPTRLKIEHGRDDPGSLRNQIRVTPARALLERATLEPREVPTMDRRAVGFCDELLEGPFHRRQVSQEIPAGAGTSTEAYLRSPRLRTSCTTLRSCATSPHCLHHIRAYDSALCLMRALARGSERRAAMTEDELIELLRERQNNGRTSYLTFGDLVAMVPSDQIDEWRTVLAKVRAADAARDAEEDAD